MPPSPLQPWDQLQRLSVPPRCLMVQTAVWLPWLDKAGCKQMFSFIVAVLLMQDCLAETRQATIALSGACVYPQTLEMVCWICSECRHTESISFKPSLSLRREQGPCLPCSPCPQAPAAECLFRPSIKP